MTNEDPHAANLNANVRRIWDANAEWWDDRIGDGNDFQLQLIEPATERLLDLRPGETILDVACGAGRLSRRYAELGAHVVACDFSAKFIERARRRTPAGADVEYHVIDACDREQLLTLGARRFDAAVATMALMDMAAIEPCSTPCASCSSRAAGSSSPSATPASTPQTPSGSWRPARPGAATARSAA